jgi:starch synthase
MMQKIRLALLAWEIGRVNSGLGAKAGGLGSVMEELPLQLYNYAQQEDIALEIELLSPCFAHYDKRRLEAAELKLPVFIEGHQFNFSVYTYTFEDGIKAVYFWDDWQLNWSRADTIYPEDSQTALKLYAAVSQAMAVYIKERGFNTIHCHDYHLGLVPFYLGDDFLQDCPLHFTIHNASHQGVFWFPNGGYEALWRLGLPGDRLFHKYFDYFDLLNFMKAVMIKTHQMGGKITTVSGDLKGTWGYAAELKESESDLWNRARTQKNNQQVNDVFLPNRHLDIFEQLPIVGVTNGMSADNHPESLPELKAQVLNDMQKRRSGQSPLFSNPKVQAAMSAEDHTFSSRNLAIKNRLKKLLHLEAFGTDAPSDLILFAVVGRLVAQKNLGMVAEVAARSIEFDPGIKFVILASANDPEGYRTEERFYSLTQQFPRHVYFNNSFNQPLSKLILAGSDFCLIPSRFEPCGLVDYEASLLGTIVIGRRVGGLSKVAHVAYLYDWLDVGDVAGEAEAFLSRIRKAVTAFRDHPQKHVELMRNAMEIDASWEPAARTYLRIYRFGHLIRRWWSEKGHPVPDAENFLKGLNFKELMLFQDFFSPIWGDQWDWELGKILSRRKNGN